MKVIGITGGIGAGKSTILEYIAREHQARVMQADEVGHLLTWPGRPCYDEIVKIFGTEILKENKTIDRKVLGDLVFADKLLLKKLNEIVHPAVKEYIIKELAYEKKQGTKYFFIEAALLIEDHYDTLCDEIWYIYVSETKRRKRLQELRGYTANKCDAIFANQMTEDEFRKYADYEIDNGDDIACAYLQIERRMKMYETL